MSRRCRIRLFVFLLGGVAGALAFLVFVDPQILNLAATGWIRDLDQLQSYIAWVQFNRHPAEGSTWIADYPVGLGITLGQADAIPLVSWLLRALRLFKGSEQWFGLWVLSCYALQGAFAASLAQRWCASVLGRVTATVLLAASPWFLNRIGHLTLCAQWLPLASLLLFTPRSDRVPSAQGVGDALLFFGPPLLASGVHPYLAAMCLIISFCWLGSALLLEPRRWKGALLAAVALLGGSLAVTRWSGFMAGAIEPMTPGTLGFYTADVLAFFNSYGWGRIVPSFARAHMGQAEGFTYLGAGGILLVVASLPFLRRQAAPSRAWRALTTTATIAWVLSLGEYVRIAGKWLVNLHLVYAPFYPLLGPFRSIGRFAWIPATVVVIAAIRRLETRLAPRTFGILLTCALSLQAADLSLVALSKVAREPENKPEHPFWAATGPRVANILTVPPAWARTPCPGDERAADRFRRYARLAAIYGLGINGVITSRSPAATASAYCDSFLADLDRGHLDEAAVYVVAPAYRLRFARAAGPSWQCTEGDDGDNWCQRNP